MLTVESQHPRSTPEWRADRDRQIAEHNRGVAAKYEDFAAEFGMKYRSLNNGEHREFKRPGLIVDWFPSTGRYMVNKKCNRSARIHSLDELRKVIAKVSAAPPLPVGKKTVQAEGVLSAPATCPCKAPMPWHLFEVGSEKYAHRCRCGRRWQWMSPTTARET